MSPGPDPLVVLERAPLLPFYLLYGEEPFLVDRAVALLGRRFASEGGQAQWRTVWAHEEQERLVAALDDLTAPSLFGGASVLVVRHVEVLNEAGTEAILKRLDAVGRGSRLVLVGGAVDARRRLVGTCQRAGAAYAFAPLADVATARRWVTVLARERGHAIDGATVDELLDRVGFGLGVLDGEIEKLSLHVGPKHPIDAAAVRALVGAVRAHGVEELTDRLGRGDVGGAIHTFRQLMADGEAPIRVLAFLAANMRRALHVAELADAGMRNDDIARRIGMPPWLVQKSMGRGTAVQLRAVLEELKRVDLELKRSRPAEAVFERALLSVPGGRTRSV